MAFLFFAGTDPALITFSAGERHGSSRVFYAISASNAATAAQFSSFGPAT